MNSSSRNKKSTKQKDDAAGNHPSPSQNGISFLYLFSFMTLAVYFIQFLIPTESIELGNRLWIPQLWLGIGVMAGFYYSQDFINLFKWNRPGKWLDLFVMLLVAGHIISGLYFLSQPANQRASVNAMWEWIGLGMSWILIRIFLHSEQNRIFFRTLFISSISSIALFGIYQHYISFPSTASEYKQLRERLDELEAASIPQEPLKQQRHYRELNQVIIGLTQMGAPLQLPERRVWEDRLQDSTEPLGFFALTNSFAGILVVGFLFSFQGFLVQYQNKQNWWLILGLSLIILFCLLLTKSRTAWIGLLSGIFVWFTLSTGSLSKKLPVKKILGGILAFALLLTGFIVVAQFTKGFDKEVLSQALKSFQYRLQYWTGTWSILKDSPVMGSGPGNFRQNYLKHKLPESSEEIGDPHNLFLDVWVNGGIISLIGLVGLSACFLIWFIKGFSSKRQPDDIKEKPSSSQIKKESASTIQTSAGIFFFHFLAFSVVFFLETRIDERILVIGVVNAIIYSLLSSSLIPVTLSQPVLLAGIGALLTHLLGAGGIEMPAIVGTILILISMYQAGQEKSQTPKPSKNILLVTSIGIIFLLGFFTGLLPVTKATHSIDLGDLEIQYGDDYSQAENFYQEAAKQDPLSPDPPRRLSELYFRKWKQQKSDSMELIDESIQYLESSISKNPLHSQGYYQLGVRYRNRYEKSNQIEDLDHSVNFLEKALARYPTEIRILIDLVKSSQLYTDPKKQQKSHQYAAKALNLNEINHREGHADKYLSEEILEYLSQIN